MGSATGSAHRGTAVGGAAVPGGYLALMWLFEPVKCELFASDGSLVLGTLDSHVLPG